MKCWQFFFLIFVTENRSALFRNKTSQRGMGFQGATGKLGGEGYVHSLDCGEGFIRVHIF